MIYSGLFRRLFAFAFDCVALLCIYMLSGVLLSLNIFLNPISALPMLGFWFYGGMFLIAWLYFAGMESSRLQGTIGKKILGMKVTDLKGNRISFWRATARYFGRMLSRVLLLLGFVTILFTKKKQAIHDMITRTVIILNV